MDKQVVAGSVPPLDTFAVAVAATITLLFVTVLLVSGSLALEREENTFTRLTRGLVSREGLLLEKAILGTGAALAVTLLMLLAITPFQSIGWSRIYLIVPAILLGGGRLLRARIGDRRGCPGGPGERPARLRARAPGGLHLAGAVRDGQQDAA